MILCFAVCAAAAAQAEEKKDKKKDAPKPVEAGRVYTQADLERVIQQSKDAPTTPLPPAQPGEKTALPPTQPGEKTALPASSAKETKPMKPGDGVSFSNDDLEKMFGKVEEKPSPDPDAGLPKLPDPMGEVSDWQGQREAAARRRDDAAARVAQLEGEIRDLEQRGLAVRNPLLPRPAPPAGMEGGWEKMSGGERATAIDARLAQRREELAKARQDAAKAAVDAKAD
ncbi:MAG TPA: hypothetical protein VFV75_17130 [Candidatus Polarisedimenticolaceae bacterium]|nr:hypothetical protein [Candidatus Polarisedimenticolaceae bacterium]HEX5044626.1 hypothetical protein [Candidatus Polarisedimenticolaceae bacterium]